MWPRGRAASTSARATERDGSGHVHLAARPRAPSPVRCRVAPLRSLGARPTLRTAPSRPAGPRLRSNAGSALAELLAEPLQRPEAAGRAPLAPGGPRAAVAAGESRALARAR